MSYYHHYYYYAAVIMHRGLPPPPGPPFFSPSRQLWISSPAPAGSCAVCRDSLFPRGNPKSKFFSIPSDCSSGLFLSSVPSNDRSSECSRPVLRTWADGGSRGVFHLDGRRIESERRRLCCCCLSVCCLLVVCLSGCLGFYIAGAESILFFLDYFIRLTKMPHQKKRRRTSNQFSDDQCLSSSHPLVYCPRVHRLYR